MKKLFLLVILCLAGSASAQNQQGVFNPFYPFGSNPPTVSGSRLLITNVPVTVSSAAPVTLISPASGVYADIDWAQLFNFGTSGSEVVLSGGGVSFPMYYAANGGGANSPNSFTSIKELTAATPWILTVNSSGATIIGDFEFYNCTR